MRLINLFKITITPLLILGVVIGLFSHPAAAAPVIGFNAGRIIDDSVFVNKNTMTAQQIQDFFWAKGSGCTNGESACLKQYFENGRVAAQIVYDTAQEFSINPQVLIATLQKETGLVTANQPQNWRYRTAMGYGCPDSTPGVCNSTYYGFTNQVRWTARMFRAIMNDSPTWYTPYVLGSNYIQWNPNGGCGGSNVYIQNRATQALYNYTPYRPNQSALNAGYGTGDGCSSYGNRNFYLYFTDWFGSPRGMLVRTVNDPTVYLYDDGKKVRLSSMDLAAQFGLSQGDLRFINQQEMDAIPLATAPFSSDLGQIVKSESDSDQDGGSVYIVDNGRRIRVADYQTFTDYGLDGKITYLSLETILSIPQANNTLTNFIQAPDLSPFQVTGQTKRVVFEMQKLNQLNPSGIVTPFSWFTMNLLPNTGAPLVDDSAYVVVGPDKGVRLYTGNSFYQFGDIDIYDCWGLGNLKSFNVTSYDRVGGNDQHLVSSCFATNGIQSYLMAQNKKYSFSTSAQKFNISPIVSSLTTASPKQVLKGRGDELSYFENSVRRPITNMGTFFKLGLTDESIEKLPEGTYQSIPYGSKKFAVGDLFAEPGGGVSVVDSPTSRLKIISAQIFNHYNLSWNNLIGVSTQDLSGYPQTNYLEPYAKEGTTSYLLDSGNKYIIPSALDVSIGINRAALPEYDSVIFEKARSKTMTKFIKPTSNSAVYMLDQGKKR